MNKIQKYLVKYGRAADQEKLRTYVSSLTIDEIKEFISLVITSSEAPKCINYLLQGFTDVNLAKDFRQKVIKHILEQMGTRVISTDLQNSIISKICMDLKRYPVPNLVELTSICVDMVHIGDPKTNSIWKELLPALMSLLTDRQSLRHNGLDLTGSEFKSKIMDALCIVRWPNDIVIPLTSMFMEIELSKEDHHKICNKLCMKIYEMDPSYLPPLVHQLLILCEAHNNICPIFTICHYFSVRLHKDLEKNDSEQTENSIEQDSTELQNSERTILYHIHSLVASQTVMISNFLNALRVINKWPEFVLRTFTTMLLLVVASIKDLKQTVYDIIRVAIYRQIKHTAMTKESAWLRNTIKEQNTLDNLLINIIESVKYNIMMSEFIIGLGFDLLNYSGDCAEKIHKIGTTILLKLSKKQTRLAPTILQKLVNIIISDSDLQYTDCLSSMVQYIPFVLIQNQDNKHCVMNGILEAPAVTSKRILTSIVPLAKLSPQLRDSLMIQLEKIVSCSNDVSDGQMGVYGLCLLLKNLSIGIPNSASLSQQSLVSLISQVGSEQKKLLTCNTTSFEGICLQILSVLQRSLTKDIEIRLEIYQGFLEASRKNPPLCCNILDLLLTNLQNYLSTGGDNAVINFDNLIIIRDDAVTISDSLGDLITCITFILTKAKMIDTSTSDNRTLKKIEGTLDFLSEKMQSCQLEDYGLGDEFHLSDGDIENSKKMEIWRQLIMIEESLIIYKIASWSTESENQRENIILSLYKKYKEFVDYSKNKKNTKKKDFGKNTSRSQSNTQFNTSSTVKFKIPKTLLTLHDLSRLLTLLYSDCNEFTSNEQTKFLKGNKEFHNYALQNILGILHELIHSKNAEQLSRKRHLQQLVECASIIFEKCVCSLEALVDFDLNTAVCAVEAVYQSFQLVDTHLHDKFEYFLCGLYPTGKESNFQDLFKKTIAHYKNVLNTYLKTEAEFSVDQDSKIAASLVETMHVFCRHMTPDGPLATETLEWLRLLAHDIKNITKPIIKAFMGLLFHFDTRVKIISNLCENAALQVCSLLNTINEEEISSPNPLPIITEYTVEPIVQGICEGCRENLDRVDWVVQYITAYYTVLSYSTVSDCDSEYEQLKMKESFVCAQLCHIIGISNTLSNAQVLTGICSDSILKTLLHLYQTLSNLTKYFTKRTSGSSLALLKARFEKVVKLAGKKLCVTAYRFITHMEEMQESKEKSKVLRQTRMIPNLIFAIETFRKSVLQLCAKTNDSTKELLVSSMNIGTTRDFRLKLPKLQDALQNITAEESIIDNSETVISETEPEESAINQSDSDNESIPRKRSRLSK